MAIDYRKRAAVHATPISYVHPRRCSTPAPAPVAPVRRNLVRGERIVLTAANPTFVIAVTA